MRARPVRLLAAPRTASRYLGAREREVLLTWLMALLRYFLTDHTATDIERAVRSPRVLTLAATDGCEVADGLRGIAEQLAASGAAAVRVAALAVRTLQDSAAAQ